LIIALFNEYDSVRSFLFKRKFFSFNSLHIFAELRKLLRFLLYFFLKPFFHCFKLIFTPFCSVLVIIYLFYHGSFKKILFFLPNFLSLFQNSFVPFTAPSLILPFFFCILFFLNQISLPSPKSFYPSLPIHSPFPPTCTATPKSFATSYSSSEPRS
jgi:hypothetical protein